MTLPTIPGYTAEDLAALAPEELSALQSDSGDGEDELREIVGEGAGDGEGDGAAAGENGAPAAGDKPAGEQAAAEETPPEPKVYVAEAPADAEAQLTAAKEAKAAAKEADKEALRQLHDGEIDFDQYQKVKESSDNAIEAANETISTVQTALNNAKIAQDMSEQKRATTWSNEIAGMMKSAKGEGLDYTANAELAKELNGLVKAFGLESQERGMDDTNLEASKWALQQAHATMKARHPELVKTVSGKADTNKPDANGARHNLQTLSVMPNADRALGDNDAVQKLGSLEGEDIERALAGMSPGEVEKLMATL